MSLPAPFQTRGPEIAPLLSFPESSVKKHEPPGCLSLWVGRHGVGGRQQRGQESPHWWPVGRGPVVGPPLAGLR